MTFFCYFWAWILIPEARFWCKLQVVKCFLFCSLLASFTICINGIIKVGAICVTQGYVPVHYYGTDNALHNLSIFHFWPVLSFEVKYEYCLMILIPECVFWQP